MFSIFGLLLLRDSKSQYPFAKFWLLHRHFAFSINELARSGARNSQVQVGFCQAR